MSARARVKSVTKGPDSADLKHYFNQLTGVDTPDLDVVMPKFDSIMASISALRQAIETFAPIVASFSEHEAHATKLVEFAGQLKKLEASPKPSEEPAAWAALKGHDAIQTCIVICNNLAPIHAHLRQPWDTVDPKFMLRWSAQMAPFPFAPLDFRSLWVTEGEQLPSLRKLIFAFLAAVFTETYAIYSTTHSPDINIKNMCSVIIDALGGIRSHPELSRCGRAFARIEKSIGLLESKFDEYYKDFLESKDPSNIFTSFVSDVATDCETDTQLVFQCRRIVQFYKKKAAERSAANPGDPGSNGNIKMFETMLKSYDSIESTALADGKSSAPADEDAASEADDDPVEADDDRDLDDLLSQINNPRVMAISAPKTALQK